MIKSSKSWFEYMRWRLDKIIVEMLYSLNLISSKRKNILNYTKVLFQHGCLPRNKFYTGLSVSSQFVVPGRYIFFVHESRKIRWFFKNHLFLLYSVLLSDFWNYAQLVYEKNNYSLVSCISHSCHLWGIWTLVKCWLTLENLRYIPVLDFSVYKLFQYGCLALLALTNLILHILTNITYYSRIRH